MKLFSERQGITPARCELQIKDIDVELRSKLWNAFQIQYWDNVRYDELSSAVNTELLIYLKRLWHDYFKRPLDTLPHSWTKAHKEVRGYFFDCAWHDVYNLIEFTANRYPSDYANKHFIAACSVVLEEEFSGYRIVGRQVAPITSEEAIGAIEQAQQSVSGLQVVGEHLRQALGLFSDKKQPDYRNSIKESISAVEAICRLVARSPKATLGEALKALASQFPIHPALGGAFDKLYGYTSDSNGIRHALLDESHLEQEDALFMLVSCSGFINDLIAKCARAGIKL
jgi:AbiJ N-terminal domain 4